MKANKSSEKRATIKTVAADAGVSVSAVSKVLRDAYGVSDGLRGRVNASMERLDYRPSVAARGMRGKSYTFGVLMNDMSNMLYPEMLEGINAMAHSKGYQAIIGISQHETSLEADLVDAMIDRQMDGIITIGPQLLPEAAKRSIPSAKLLVDAALRIPTVVVGSYDDSGVLDTVNNDDFAGAKLATEHLIEQGYRRIAFITPDLQGLNPVSVAQRRHAGYVEAMCERGLEENISVYASPNLNRDDLEVVRKSMRDMFSRKERPDAIFCWSDLIAFDVLSALLSLGYDVPNDVGIVGYDDTKACDLFQNSLSSVNQNGAELGKKAAEMLLERIEGRTTAEHFVLTPRLVARRSSKRSK